MSLCGVKFIANPTEEQKLKLSQWMGCSRFIYNSKCAEDEYFRKFRNSSLSLTGHSISIDRSYSQFKSELTPWLSDCPSQILRSSAFHWYEAYQRYFKGLSGRPRKKKKGQRESIWLTNEVFTLKSFTDDKTGETKYKLFVGTQRNNIGYLEFFPHRDFLNPNSVTISKKNGNYYVSFNYENGKAHKTKERLLEEFSKLDESTLEEKANGLDRGVVVPLYSSTNEQFDFTPEQKASLAKCELKLKEFQKKLARQKLGSHRREKTKRKIASLHQHMANIRRDFAHKTTRKLVDSDKEVFVLEDLKVKNMTASPEPKLSDDKKTYLPNGANAKAGLNKAILSKCWGMVSTFLNYKALKLNKLVVKIPPQKTSQQCAKCGHIDPESRISQAEFICKICQHSENADLNAAKVIKGRGIKQILDFPKSQSVSSESSLAGTQERTRRGIVRPYKPKVSKAAHNPVSTPTSRKKRETCSLYGQVVH